MNSVDVSTHPSPHGIPRAARLLFSFLSHLRHGRLDVITPDGQRITFQGDLAGPSAYLRIDDWSVCFQALKSGDIGFAEAFLSGKWTTDDLVALLQLIAQNRAVLETAMRGRWLGKLFYRLRHLLRSNTRRGSRRNIHAHYDLGNEFYEAWLDPTMSYSSALFDSSSTRSLESAQLAKYRRILDALGVKKGDRVLEIGCGWGGFAELAAAECGAYVQGVTLSSRQLEFARERMRSKGLDSQVELALCDYRDVTGTFDYVVSIEMFEAVGEAYWPAFFNTVRNRLRPGGRAMIQSIVIADELFDNYRRSTDFIQQYVFPGGMLPSPSEFTVQASRAGLGVRNNYFFGIDYAETLQRWRERYNDVAPSLRKLGFDDRFERLWNFYLCYCEAGFRVGSIDVGQMELEHV
jgi:cyclopropane-fatty-acyl-phospholipid synthase